MLADRQRIILLNLFDHRPVSTWVRENVCPSNVHEHSLRSNLLILYTQHWEIADNHDRVCFNTNQLYCPDCIWYHGVGRLLWCQLGWKYSYALSRKLHRQVLVETLGARRVNLSFRFNLKTRHINDWFVAHTALVQIKYCLRPPWSTEEGIDKGRVRLF